MNVILGTWPLWQLMQRCQGDDLLICPARQRIRSRGGHKGFLPEEGYAARSGLIIRLRRSALRLVTCLAVSDGFASHAEVFDALWGDDPEGGPDYAGRAVSVIACFHRKHYACLGLKLVARAGFGWELRFGDAPRQSGQLSIGASGHGDQRAEFQKRTPLRRSASGSLPVRSRGRRGVASARRSRHLASPWELQQCQT